MPSAAMILPSASTQALFTEACQRHSVKRVNPGLLKYFKNNCPTLHEVEAIDLSGNYIGNRGVLALADCLEHMPNIRFLSLREHKLYNSDISEDSVQGNVTMDRVLEVLKSHPSIKHLDLSSNAISNHVGRKLLSLVQMNPNIIQINVDDTRISTDLQNRITERCAKNAEKISMREQTRAAVVALAHESQRNAAAAGHTSDDMHFVPQTWDPQSRKCDDLLDDEQTNARQGSAGRRAQMFCVPIDPEEAKNYIAPVIPKSPMELETILNLLSSNVLFSFLSLHEKKTVGLAMKTQRFESGGRLMTQGEVGGECLYIIQSGCVDIIKDGKVVTQKGTGEAVGELELMYDVPGGCAATVQVPEGCVIETWKLDRQTYRMLVMGTVIRRREEYAKHIEHVPLLKGLSVYEKMTIADALELDEWADGTRIVEYDTEGKHLYLILEGTVQAIGRTTAGEPLKVCDFGVGDYFGELEFINNHRTVADVVASSFVRTAKINRRHFELCMGPVVDVLKRNADYPKYEYYKNMSSALKANKI